MFYATFVLAQIKMFKRMISLKEWNIYLIRFKYIEYFLSVENKRLWITYLISMELFPSIKWIIRIYLFEDKLKMDNWNRIFMNILKYKFIMEFICESGICMKINVDLFLKCWNNISCKDILENK